MFCFQFEEKDIVKEHQQTLDHSSRKINLMILIVILIEIADFCGIPRRIESIEEIVRK